MKLNETHIPKYWINVYSSVSICTRALCSQSQIKWWVYMLVCWHLCVCVCQCACANRRWHLRKQCRGLQPPSWRFASQSLVEDQGDGGLRKCSSTFGPKRRTVLGQMFLCWPQTFHTRSILSILINCEWQIRTRFALKRPFFDGAHARTVCGE